MRRFLLLASVLAGVFGVTAGTASAGILTVTLAGSGAGAVTSSPAGIDCSNVPGSTQTACSYDYGFNFNTATLSAAPGEGSAFVSWSGGVGGTCIGATNPCVTHSLLLAGSVTATFAPKPDPPTVTTGLPSDVTFPSATVAGIVNPGSSDFPVTDCYFEYGPTTAYGEKSRCTPGAIGAGVSPVSVSASVGVLDPGKTYHYRLVGRNGGGTRFGDDQTFVSGAPAADECPNAGIRAQQGAFAQRLPRCGAYELVSPGFTAGQSAGVSVGTADGNRAVLYSVGGFAGTENLPDLGVQYASERTNSGWKTSAIAPPASDFPYTLGALDWTRDGRRSLWFVNLKADEGTNRFTPIVRDADGSFHLAGPTQNEKSNQPGGASADLRTVVQRTTTRPALSDGTLDSRDPSMRSLYASVLGPNGQLSVRQVAYRAGTTMFPSCSVELGGAFTGSSSDARNAISQDGRKIFFTSAGSGGCGAAAMRRVWAKVDDNDPIDLSESQCPATCGAEAAATFRAASRDGSRVYFSTKQRLLPEDQDMPGPVIPGVEDLSQNDLYEYDFNAAGQKLRLVTGSADPAGAAVSVGSGVVRASEDGSFVYFGATGRALAGANSRGVVPSAGGKNLYVYHRSVDEQDGTITFVGTVDSVNELRAQLSSNGRYFLFQSSANLTGDRVAGDVHSDVFRYDAQEDELLRVWSGESAHNGSARVAGAAVSDSTSEVGGIPSPAASRSTTGGWNAGLQLSDDGELVGFTTAEPLSRDDRNAQTDAYLWEASTGKIEMLTTGTSRPGNQYAGSRFTGMTPSGDSLFVVSASPLLREHTSGQNATYVVRRNGGFPTPPSPAEPCEGDDCQPGSSTGPGLGGPAATSLFAGPGNALPAPARQAATVKVGRVKSSVRGSSTRLAVRVSGRGKIQVSGSNLVRTSLAVGKASTYRMSVKLSRKAKRALRRRGSLRVRANIRFSPEKGSPVTARVSVRFTSSARKRASGRLLREPGVLAPRLRKGL